MNQDGVEKRQAAPAEEAALQLRLWTSSSTSLIQHH